MQVLLSTESQENIKKFIIKYRYEENEETFEKGNSLKDNKVSLIVESHPIVSRYEIYKINMRISTKIPHRTCGYEDRM